MRQTTRATDSFALAAVTFRRRIGNNRLESIGLVLLIYQRLQRWTEHRTEARVYGVTWFVAVGGRLAAVATAKAICADGRGRSIIYVHFASADPGRVCVLAENSS